MEALILRASRGGCDPRGPKKLPSAKSKIQRGYGQGKWII